MFYSNEIEEELRRLEIIKLPFDNTAMDSIISKALPIIEAERQKSFYKHERQDCSDECKKKGQ